MLGRISDLISVRGLDYFVYWKKTPVPEHSLIIQSNINPNINLKLVLTLYLLFSLPTLTPLHIPVCQCSWTFFPWYFLPTSFKNYAYLKQLLLLQPLRWWCVDCVIHHERYVRKEQKYMYVARTKNNRVNSLGDLYCCLLPRCEALRTCRSEFPIATLWLNSRVFWIFWIRTPAASDRIWSEVFFAIAGLDLEIGVCWWNINDLWAVLFRKTLFSCN